MGKSKSEANNRYMSNTYGTIKIIVRKDSTYNKETLKKVAADRGMSLNELFITAVIKYIEET